MLKALKRLLTMTDYRITTASCGIEGLNVLERNEVQVIISYYRMSGMSGTEFFAKVRAKYPDTVRILLSGSADTVAMAEAINEGEIYRFVPKPWNDLDPLTTIHAAFERFHLQ